jgi:hypothetical protein
VEEKQHPRLLQDVALDILLITALLKHLGQAVHTPHTGAQGGSDFRRMHMLVKFIWVSNTSMVESLSSGHERPERNAISACDDILGNAVTYSIPPGGELAGDKTVVGNCLRDIDASALLQFDVPLATFASPDITVIPMLLLEFLRV